jgi:hypothetical protein
LASKKKELGKYDLNPNLLVQLNKWGASQVLFLLAINQLDWPITRKNRKIETLKGPQNINFYVRM